VGGGRRVVLRRGRGGGALGGRQRLQRILSAIVLAFSILTLLMMSVPLERADNIPRAWIKGAYYTISTLIATLSGMMIALVIMLLTAVLGIVEAIAPGAELRADD
jgi:hypothetical protein